ncbi:hypothetical protein BACCOP_02503 [Phocaeicola coprocola DSM 17136]|uniref:Uncharacterized protein n=1 Tax=Phocaeicola coprocola DSM 17136 TaxID=470145 RepID=B3JKS2_9BACT|nr:hypothetical protein BACCOP_02503 [Phocaeicola coprocola DSM 17136]
MICSFVYFSANLIIPFYLYTIYGKLISAFCQLFSVYLLYDYRNVR